jgi:predicted NUDIX family phosphoesterase
MEFVFVTPREALFPASFPQGFRRFQSPGESAGFLSRVRSHGFFVERRRAETTPAWKQVIPYIVVVGDEGVLLMRRRGGGEARLVDKLSIGVGGHINPVDGDDAEEIVLAAARRELSEEIELEGPLALELVGFLNDDSNPVGAVHVGLVFTANVSGRVHIREQDVLEGRMVVPEELRACLARGANLETWSSILIAHLDELRLERHTATTRSAS